MDTGCRALISRSGDDDNEVKPSLKNQRDDKNDNGDDWADLLSAAQDGLRSDHVMSILRKNPALIHIADPLGDTVLHVVARAGYVETVCNLIEFIDKQGDSELKERVLREQNGGGDTALHLAVMNGHREVAYHLDKAHTSAKVICNNDGITPYELAKEAGYSELLGSVYVKTRRSSAFSDVEIGVIKKDLIGVSVPVNWTGLYEATMNCQEYALITGLRKHGKELLMQQNEVGETLLHAAVSVPEMGPLRQLVEFMIDNYLTDAAFLTTRDGLTPLHIAVYYGDLSKVVCLMKAAPESVYQVNRYGFSPLYQAVDCSYQDIVKHMVSQSNLLSRASEILLHPNHKTLAHLAIQNQSFGTLQVLMEHLPELIYMTDKKGWRPLSFAAHRGYLEGTDYLLTNFPKYATEYDVDGSPPIHKAVGGGHVSIVRSFISHCPQSVYHINKKGQSVLHIAVRYAANCKPNKVEILAYLQKEIKMDDAFLNLQDRDGKFFVDYAN